MLPFTLKKHLGRGNFGVVELWAKQDSTFIALKRINIGDSDYSGTVLTGLVTVSDVNTVTYSNSNDEQRNELATAIGELNLGTSLNHENIVQVYGGFQDTNGISIAMEYSAIESYGPS